MKKQKYLESKKLSLVLFIFIFFMYAVVYMTKNMFSSAMATIVEEGAMTKSQTGFINAVFWFVYALFQFLGGFAADKYSPQKLVMIGMGGAAIANLVIYFNQSYPVIIIAWTFNAVVQFGLWPGIFKIITTQICPDMIGTAVFWMLLSSSVGLGISMLVASFVSRWQQNFLVSVISLSVMLLLYIILSAFLDKRMVVKEVGPIKKYENTIVEKKPMLPLFFSSGLLVFAIVCLFRVAVDNGVKMMTPVMLMESYSELPAAISTRISSVLVIFSVLGTFIAGFVKAKITNCEAKAQILIYTATLLPLVAVCFVGRIHYIYVFISLCLVVMVAHGAAPFSQSFTALRFEKHGRTGAVSGILNSAASVGNILASYVFAKMAELMPWSQVALSWVILMAVCSLLCLAVLPRWTRFIK